MADRTRSGVVAWAWNHVPTRDSMERNRWLRPVAHLVLAPALWRFTRRSVPRGVALGLVTGTLLPVAHMPLAAVLSLPLKANVPVAVGTTLLNNPVTVPILWVAAYRIGRWVLRLDATVPGRPIEHEVVANASWLHWLMVEVGPATMVGLLIIAGALGVAGYAASAIGWRLWIARKWRNRHVINHV